MFFYIRNLVALQQSLSLEDKINVFLFPQSATTAVASARLQLIEPRTRWRQNWAFDTHEKSSH